MSGALLRKKATRQNSIERLSTETMNPMRRALIVGVDNYKNAELNGSVNDARRLEAVLKHNFDSSRNFDCRVLAAPLGGSHLEVTRPVLREQIKELFAHDVDVALFYFSGHGYLNDLGGYLVTQDVAAYDEGILMSEILTLATNATIREVVIILDCCHSGAFGNNPTQPSQTPLREGVSILTSSRATQLSYEVGGEGVFTSLLCDALEGGAADVLGNVTVASIYSYLDLALGAWEQRPLFKSNVSKLITLRYCKPEVDPAILRLLPIYFQSPDSEHQLDPSYESTSASVNPDNAKIFEHLQECRNARLVVTTGEKHFFDAAMSSKSCILTPLGKFYWKLAKGGKI